MKPVRMKTRSTAAARCLLALAALAAPAAACPYCALSQAGDTLVYIACFLVAPYLIVSGTWLVIRHILRAEQESL
jgi:hypothetical protein